MSTGAPARTSPRILLGYRAVERVREPFLAVRRQVGHMPDLAKRFRHVVGLGAAVFNDKETHDETALSNMPRGSMLGGTHHSALSRPSAHFDAVSPYGIRFWK
jgi:hypothetical protein